MSQTALLLFDFPCDAPFIVPIAHHQSHKQSLQVSKILYSKIDFEPQRHRDTDGHGGRNSLSVKLRASVSPWFKSPEIEKSFKSVMKLSLYRIELPNDAVSDTSKADSSNAVKCTIKKYLLKEVLK